MALVLWTKRYSVGVDKLDADHLVMASLLNHIDEARRYRTDEADVNQVIKVLIDHARRHFRREERLLEKYGYPDLDNHKKLHASIRDKLGRLHKVHSLSLDPADSEAITRLLCAWLDDHLLMADMRYKGFLKQAMARPGLAPPGARTASR